MHLPKTSPIQVVVIACFFALVAVFTRLAYDGGSNALTVVTVRAVGMLVLTALFLRINNVTLRLPARDRNVALAIGILLALNNFALNRSIELIPVPLMVLVFYTYPVITSLASWARGEERFSARSAAALVLALVGLALALQADFAGSDLVGLAFAAFGACCWSALLLLSGHYFRDEDSRPRTFYMNVTAAAIFLCACAVTGDVALPHTGLGWASLAAVPFVFAIGIIGSMVAAASMGAMRSGFYMNFEPIASIFLSALILDQQLAPIQLAGAALVIAALFLFRPLRPVAVSEGI